VLFAQNAISSCTFSVCGRPIVSETIDSFLIRKYIIQHKHAHTRARPLYFCCTAAVNRARSAHSGARRARDADLNSWPGAVARKLVHDHDSVPPARAWYILHECAVQVTFNLLLRKAIKILAIVQSVCLSPLFFFFYLQCNITRKCKNIYYVHHIIIILCSNILDFTIGFVCEVNTTIFNVS